MPVNGNYAPHQGYGSLEQSNAYAYSSNITAGAPQPSVPAPAPPSTAGSTTSQSAPSKDEVGWYFVEQYYTTLSRNPEKVYLFYNKRSQFVSGQETDKVAVCVGQRAINDRIKELEFQDTKVRVTNVDSQASDSNIVIQVIGEISNKSQPHRKFVQTFILATQTNGYFVLNDIFRYLVDEEDEAVEEPAPAQEEEVQQAPAAESGYQEPPPTVAEAEPKTLTSSSNPAEVESDAQKVDKELEEQVPTSEVPATRVNGVNEEVKQAEEVPAAAPEPAAVEPSRPDTKDTDLQPEKPQAPEPTPAASPPKQATPQPAAAPKPAAPAVPKTWASLAASANKVATPAAPSSSASSQTSQQPKAAATKPAAPTAAAAATPASSTATPPTAPAAQREESPAASSQDEWTAVGGSHNRQQSRQTNQQQQQQGPQSRGYIKNVYENVKDEDLRASLERFGELSDCHIARAKVSLKLT